MDKKRLCIADFDDTLILTDSLKTVMLSEHWLISPKLFLAGIRLFFSMKLRSNEMEARSRFKNIVLEKYGRLSQSKKDKYINEFRTLINRSVTDKINASAYDRILIISASEEELIRSVLDGYVGGFEVMANRISGNLTTCYGSEKVIRLKELIPNPGSYEITVYTDSYSDMPLIELSDEAYLVDKDMIKKIKGMDDNEPVQKKLPIS